MPADTLFMDTAMERILDFESFKRMDYEAKFPRLFPPPETYRPLPPSDEQVKERGEAFWTYPLRLQYYEEKCYALFLDWNRKLLERTCSVQHIFWMATSLKSCSLSVMDENTGKTETATRFYFNQKNLIVITHS